MHKIPTQPPSSVLSYGTPLTIPFQCSRTSTNLSLVCDFVTFINSNNGIILLCLCFRNYRFKTAFNEELYNSIVKNKKVIAECCIDLDEDEYPEVKEQISLRGWRRLATPKQEISIDLIHEFYANAILTEEEMEEAGGHIFRSYVRRKVVDFSPENLRNVMRFRAHVQGAATDFETRKEHDQQLDQVLADLCIPGATWKLSTGQLRVPIQLRRQELNPVARGWHEFLFTHLYHPLTDRKF
ncbi:hypothetical protein PIB30_087098 [Stylosanthes scabra]|uniref:Putative plant transposon protein domain-containing protein n=1 Tax=Stylosanthes scabra TaxID=79078 RepID=A0ABU6YW46_9FABA|nr:hypothetical protein [Stylosanthes scabra]